MAETVQTVQYDSAKKYFNDIGGVARLRGQDQRVHPAEAPGRGLTHAAQSTRASGCGGPEALVEALAALFALVSRDGGRLVRRQVLGCLSHLPVPVARGPVPAPRRPRRRRTARARGRPAAARSPCPTCAAEDGRQPRRIADRAPSAATAASLTSASSCPVARAASRLTAPDSGGTRSPHAHAATSTTDGSASSSRCSSVPATAARQTRGLVDGEVVPRSRPPGGEPTAASSASAAERSSAAQPAGTLQRAEGRGPHRCVGIGQERTRATRHRRHDRRAPPRRRREMFRQLPACAAERPPRCVAMAASGETL